MHALTITRTSPRSAAVLYGAWTTGWSSWFAEPDTARIHAHVGEPFFFGYSRFRVGDWRGSCTTIRRAAPSDRRTFVSIRGAAVSFGSSPNSLTADLRECSRMTSTYSDGMVVYDDPPRRAGRSADSRVDPRYRSFVQEFVEQTALPPIRANARG